MGKSKYGVKLVRGPFVNLAPHRDACETPEELKELCARYKAEDPDRPLAADLFSGAGGLSLGLEQSGTRVVLSVDHDPSAVATHHHHFPGMTVDWDLSDPATIERVSSLMIACDIDVLAGGPPCQPFSKAGRSLIRHQVRTGTREPHDRRRDLWRSYLEVIRSVRPRAVIMENVPDMALDKEMFILRSMVFELEQMGYGVEVRVLETWRYGVPQFRQRLILVALEDGKAFTWPPDVTKPVTLNDAISDLPPVEGGWRPEGGGEGWADYAGPITSFQRLMRAGVPKEHRHRVYDHITRPVREDDRAAFALMDPNTRYSDLPEEYKRYRDDIFDDKYKRLDGASFSRTITAHIAKDGYWYIHPEQDRTITVREAARVQTFPDWFRFAGPPSAAFRQIGNAVPPAAARALGSAVLTSLESPSNTAHSSEQTSQLLQQWFDNRGSASIPWLKAKSRWQMILAEKLLERTSAQKASSVWPLLSSHQTPGQTLMKAADLREIAGWINREERAEQILTLAEDLHQLGVSEIDDALLANLVSTKRLSKAHADMAALVVGSEGPDTTEEPVITNKGLLRVAARYVGKPVDLTNRLTDGRVTVARMIGYGESARSAHLALIDLANGLCRATPECAQCPLNASCATSSVKTQGTTKVG